MSETQKVNRLHVEWAQFAAAALPAAMQIVAEHAWADTPMKETAAAAAEMAALAADAMLRERGK